ncbi:ubiquitin specific cysteine protease, OTU family, Otu2 [Schizosaccharomyces osmophilus]|uniref:Ubiquitin specific cysteine protease, OTU family, Otu2 n=1 Tax=Schizosaccharomyces osmophilus TaxID=2545709 RepID=A0AAF0AWX5_9SCHI|nr:ubiquitin specific cysteine protease, OTU family, Otu2 [Schizosaccharomyces osmophilus]WBW73324.1 ubiquitin specific cysteine protease, OTU family, Otu2 [Schizosaccharomyces osmophilus]
MMEELFSKQREEHKQLQSSIASLRRQAKEGNKKQKKQVQQKIADMEADLSQRHAQERTDLERTEEPEEGNEQDDLVATLLKQMESTDLDKPKKSPENSKSEAVDQPKETKKSRNRQKERLERRKAEMQQLSERAETEHADTVDKQKVEKDELSKILSNSGLVAVDIIPDGHCLFASISHQLNYHFNIKLNYHQLRDRAANYIFKHGDEYSGFLLDEDTGEVMSVEQYCNEIRTTGKWGGDIEIQALSNDVQVPIYVYNTNGPIIKFEPQEAKHTTPVCIAYYQHLYGLGAHYNSLVYNNK